MTKSIAEIEKQIKELEEELKDIEDEREFMLVKTNIHVPGTARGRYEMEIVMLKDKIINLKKQLENYR